MLRNVENARAVALFGSRNEQKRENLRKQFSIESSYDTYDEMIASDEVDAVYVASPNVFHKEQTIAAARAGKHVFCEKPMGLNARECREMLKTCRECGVKLGVGFCYPLSGAQQRAKQLVEEGAIGEVSSMYISFNLAGYNEKSAGWRCDPLRGGGGPLMDLGPHLVNLACFFLEDSVASVIACVRPQKTEKKIETDAHAILEFQGGARALLDTSFVRGNMHNYSVVGERGEIRAYGTMCWRAGGRLALEQGGKEQPVDFEKTEGIEREFRLFCRAIERNEKLPPSISGEAGLHAQAVIDAIYKSGALGERCLVK